MCTWARHKLFTFCATLWVAHFCNGGQFSSIHIHIVYRYTIICTQNHPLLSWEKKKNHTTRLKFRNYMVFRFFCCCCCYFAWHRAFYCVVLYILLLLLVFLISQDSSINVVGKLYCAKPFLQFYLQQNTQTKNTLKYIYITHERLYHYVLLGITQNTIL